MRIITIILIAAFFLQGTIKSFIFIRFKINQDFIAKNLCIKKEIEENDCEGNCCLRAELEKQEKSENPLPNFLKEKIETLLYICFPTSVFIAQNNPRIKFFDFLLPSQAGFLDAVFHPPSL
ncbi:MAG: hypothetical protein J0M08_00020 [Bacteroidetes bacterium]|nr:hypothetical protein [Bacteroidota bacterium]